MASERKQSLSEEEELVCPVCYEIFTDPVILTCGHSFCRTCVQRSWEARDTRFRECPVCRKRFVLARPPCNQALNNMCENLKQQRRQARLIVCSLHSEKLKLFCLEHEEPICLVCRDSIKHTSHHFLPVEEAAQDHMEELQTALKPLEEKLKVFKDIKRTYDETAKHLKTQADNTERNIKEEFKKLHRFLQEDEEARIAALREEEKQKSEKMKEKIEGMDRGIASLSDTIKVIEEDLRADDASFLQNFKVAKLRAQVTLPDPQLVSDTLIDMAKHLGNLTFRVWEKMKEVVKFTPVILDPNTAHPCFSLSDDLTSLGWPGTRQQLPDNPERITQDYTVLDSEGFSSGKHSWEVEVGDHPSWNIGVVVKESLDRKGQSDAIWYLTQEDGEYSVLDKFIRLKRRPQRIRVQLDCDGGEVSFYDPEDMTHINTQKYTITEKIYPYFNIEWVDNIDWGDSDTSESESEYPDIKICQSEFSVPVMSS